MPSRARYRYSALPGALQAKEKEVRVTKLLVHAFRGQCQRLVKERQGFVRVTALHRLLSLPLQLANLFEVPLLALLLLGGHPRSLVVGVEMQGLLDRGRRASEVVRVHLIVGLIHQLFDHLQQPQPPIPSDGKSADSRSRYLACSHHLNLLVLRTLLSLRKLGLDCLIVGIELNCLGVGRDRVVDLILAQLQVTILCQCSCLGLFLGSLP